MTELIRYTKIQLEGELGEAVSRNLDAIEESLEDLAERDIVPGRRIAGVDVTSSGTTRVNHELGRRWTGYLVTRQDSAGSVYATDANNPAATKETAIVLSSTFNGQIDLWVF